MEIALKEKMSAGRILHYNTNKSEYTKSNAIVVAPHEFKGPLIEALLTENKKQCSEQYQFVSCEHIEDLLEWAPSDKNPPIDYVVIVLDPRDSSCITRAEDIISKIDSNYITGGRLCFVNGACSTKPAEMGVPLGHINHMSQKYSVLLINGDVLIPEKCIHLAERIMRLIASVTGFHTGVPMSVDLPGYF